MNIQMITAGTTISQLQRKIETISNNVANVNTVGFKRRKAFFQDALTHSLNNQPHPQKEAGRTTPDGIRVGYGAYVAQTAIRTEQGAPQVTGRPLDIMIEGKTGWFRILRGWEDGDGNYREEYLYTRDGNFKSQPSPSDPGQFMLVTAQGLPVLADDGYEIFLPERVERIDVSESGMVQIYDAENPNDPIEYQLDIVQINRPELLEGVGANQFRLAGDLDELEQNGVLTAPLELSFMDAEERPVSIRQGALERSNVDLTTEMTELITAQRMLQFQSRSISMADQMMALSNSIRG